VEERPQVLNPFVVAVVNLKTRKCVKAKLVGRPRTSEGDVENIAYVVCTKSECDEALGIVLERMSPHLLRYTHDYTATNMRAILVRMRSNNEG
jgi:hypothetical protein